MSEIAINEEKILKKYNAVRSKTLEICAPLEIEDYVVQPTSQVSPPKWHLAHTSWFFETFILKPYLENYRIFKREFTYLFNSYYESVGPHFLRPNRGTLSRPTVAEVRDYRSHVDSAMSKLIKTGMEKEISDLIILGLNHEQQHQELLYSDIKYILGHNPLFPVYADSPLIGEKKFSESKEEPEFIEMDAGIYDIGYDGDGFCYDNELSRHKIYLNAYSISKKLVSNGDFLEFIEDGGYEQFQHWHSDGRAWVEGLDVKAPLYWHKVTGKWMYYTLNGLREVNPAMPLCHINYYESAAYAAWKEMRLPTEGEWEAASSYFHWGNRWEWTESAYLPYPGYEKASGAIGEYNGKFMVNQKVLRGASSFTSEGHSRPSYRNFFQPYYRWQFTGIRLAH